MTAHALLSASGADRWLHCTPSALIESAYPESTSEYAEEGRLAHTVAEQYARRRFLGLPQQDFDANLAECKTHPLYQPEMLEHAELYADYIDTASMVFQSRPHIALEVRLDFSNSVPDGFGTGDCVLIGGSVLHIIDYKFGRGLRVSAEGNPQMRLYALGALQTYAPVYGDSIETVRMTVVQPRLDHIDETAMRVVELTRWAEEYVKPRAQMAYNGLGMQEAGDWCRFCRAKAACRARAEKNLLLEAEGLRPSAQLSNYEVGDILTRARDIEAWVKDLETYALTACLDGREVPGWKAVEGRSVRTIKDIPAAWGALQAVGYDEAALYRREPITLTEAEKLAGKKQFETLCGQWIVKPQGKPTLVEASDKRPPYSTLAAEAAGLEVAV